MKSILLYAHGTRLTSQLGEAQMVSGHTAANTTFNIKINGTDRSVTSDANGYFELDLTGVTLTSLREMFYNNTDLIDVTLDIDTSRVTTMEQMFRQCTNLTTINGLENFDTSSVTNISYIFEGCSLLTDLTPISGWDTSSVTNTSYMFNGCTAITFIDLSDWDIASVTSYDYFCQNSNTLTILYDSTIFKTAIVTANPNVKWVDVGVHTISGFTSDTSSVTLKINGTNQTITPNSNKYFYYDVPSGTTLTSLNQMLMNASKVVTVFIGKYINTQSVTTIASMFSSCTSLTKIYGLKYMDTSSVVNMNGLFSIAIRLDSFEGVEGWDTSNVTNMYSLAYGSVAMKFHDLTPISGWDTSSVTNMGAMFNYCNLITDLTPISGWDTSSVQDFSLMFGECVGLTDISPIYGWNTGSAISLASLFQGCNHITSVDLHLWNTTKVTYVYDMFANCTRLVDVNLSGWVCANIVRDATESLTGIEDMFSGCSALQTVDMKNWNPTNIIDISNLFKDCTNLKVLNIARWNTTGISSNSALWANFIPNRGSKTVIRDSRIFKTNIETSFIDVNWVDIHDICGYTKANTTFTLPVNEIDRSITSDSNGYFYFDLPSNETFTSLGRLLRDKTSVTKLWFGQIDVTHVTNLTDMCLRATGLKEIKGIRYWNLSSCTSIRSVFSNCTSLAGLNIKNWNVPVLTSANCAFNLTRSLTSIDLSGWTGFSGAVDCGNMFNTDSGGPTKIDIRTLDTRNVTTYAGFCRNTSTLTVYYKSSIFNSAIVSYLNSVKWSNVV